APEKAVSVRPILKLVSTGSQPACDCAAAHAGKHSVDQLLGLFPGPDLLEAGLAFGENTFQNSL
ncbi:hypothetical protein, partial [Christiangramia aquimixticola]|uniref:hypothetical protein n=1 Tax=Christiangramia aquimixticola TaxID=1697558 RepID=UPI003AA7E010